MKFLDVNAKLIGSLGDLAIHRRQEVPQWFLDDLKRLKFENSKRPEGDWMLVASVPVVIHEQWLREGYDMTREPYKETLKRLRSLSLDDFIATEKRV